MISVIVPIYNEFENLTTLYERVTTVLRRLNQPWELILVNDGSTDGSQEVLDELADRDSAVKVLSFLRNFGQTAAMMAGIDHAAASIIVPMDGDLQNDPDDIPRCSPSSTKGTTWSPAGARTARTTSSRRNFPSRMANRSSRAFPASICTITAAHSRRIEADVIKGVKLYGEMHRFIPIYAAGSARGSPRFP